MLRLAEQSRDNHRRFVERVVDSETVWMLNMGEGAAYCESNNDEQRPVLMFWSDRAYAQRVRNSGFEDCEIESLSLFEFLFRWLPGIAGDGAIIGTNWTGDLCGLEIEPLALQDELIAAMPRERLQEFQDRLRISIEEQNSGH